MNRQAIIDHLKSERDGIAKECATPPVTVSDAPYEASEYYFLQGGLATLDIILQMLETPKHEPLDPSKYYSE